MPVLDTKQADLSILRNKLGEVESQLKEAQKSNSRIRGEAENKIKQFNALNDEIKVETGMLRVEKEKSAEFTKSLLQSFEKRSQDLAFEKKKYTVELAHVDLTEAENDRLHTELAKLSDQYIKLYGELREESETRKQRSFDNRMEMDHILRSTIKLFDGQYERHAQEKMAIDAQKSVKENIMLFAEYNSRNLICEELIKEQQNSYDRYMKAKVKLEVSAATASLQTQMASELLELTMSQINVTHEAIERVDELRIQYSDMKKRHMFRSNLIGEKNRILDELDKLRLIEKDVHKKALALGKKIVKEGLVIAEQSQKLKSKELSQTFDNLAGSIDKSKNGGLSDRSGIADDDDFDFDDKFNSRRGAANNSRQHPEEKEDKVAEDMANEKYISSNRSIEQRESSIFSQGNDFGFSKSFKSNGSDDDNSLKESSSILLKTPFLTEQLDEIWRADKTDVNIMSSIVRRRLRTRPAAKNSSKL